MTVRVSIDGRGGSDTLIGGVASDLIFDEGFGTDTITDFADGNNRNDLTWIDGLANFSELTITQVNPIDVMIFVTATPADTIRGENALLAQFTSADFVL